MARKLYDYTLLQFEKGKFEPIGNYDEIKNYQFSTSELERIENNSGRIVSGTRDQVKEQLTKLARDFDIEEIVVATMAYNKEDRLRSFELLAEAFEITEGVLSS
jgi:alkanesulfonate monooxygenase SsuD/methylene tetrahydromethanopterin reductase-like flavin-dependent oxidoreductase (luciferase family)